MSCYTGKNPVKTQEEGTAIWKWAKENAIDQGMPIDKVHDAINDYFFGGQAKPEWINEILTGRKSPFRELSNDLWRKQYNRQTIIQQAKFLSQRAALGPIGRTVVALRFIPRAISVFGHGIVFPITHAGDLLMRPASWATFIKGTLKTYRAAGSSAYAAKSLDIMSRDEMYETAIRSGVDVGPKSHPVGLLSNTGKKTGFFGAAARAWDMLTVMRFELWKKQVGKFVKPGMSQSEILDIGKNLGEWANHATGSGKGWVSNLGGGTLFGPKLTQAKINRLTVDPTKTINTFARWKEATVGEKAAAWTRLSGATQYLTTRLGFLAVNAGVLAVLGSKQKINFTDPDKSDWFAFKAAGVDGYAPGMHTEIRTVAKILATAFKSRKEMRGETKFGATAKILGQYGMGKLEPGIQRVTEVGLGQNWQGRPLPWSADKGTAKKPKMSYGEYAASIGPIPLEGPIGYVYDHLKKNGANAMDATAIIKGLIIFGGGLPGFHVAEDYGSKSPSGAVSPFGNIPGLDSIDKLGN